MADYTLSPQMSLILPTVGVEPGPTWAEDLNASLTILDGHNHSPGSGNPINPSGLSINSDLTFLDNNATNLRSARFQAQGAVLSLPSDLRCLYSVGADLYFNDGSGTQIRITQSGAVAGTPGSISNLVSPASASYVAGTSTFVWQSAANTPANMDAASYVFRNLVANSKGLTLAPPAAMAADFSITLPNLPVSTNIMTLSPSGAMGASLNVDGTSLQNASNQLSIKANGVAQSALALRATASGGSNPGAGGVGYSASITALTVTSTSYVDLGMSVTITTLGRPVRIQLFPSSNSSGSGYIGIAENGTNNARVSFKLVRSGTDVGVQALRFDQMPTNAVMFQPASSLAFIDIPAAGTYTYNLQGKADGASTGQLRLNEVWMVVYED